MADASPTLLDDLAAEHAALDAVVADLTVDGWELATPSPGWRVRDQIGHLTFFDQMAFMAALDPDAFVEGRDAAVKDLAAFHEETMSIGRSCTDGELLEAWRLSREAMLDAFSDFPIDGRVAWYGPSMSTRSFLTARLMETWAHGDDVVEGLRSGGVAAERPPTDRLRHICHLGCSTRGWSYAVRGQEPPPGDVRVELVLPSGLPWSAGPEAAPERITGPAVDFCLVVTQRRNVADTALVVEGDVAADWMSVAQCFAGAPTLPPEPFPRNY